MSRAFVRANSDYLNFASAPASGTPLTIACWAQRDLDATALVLAAIGVNDTSGNYHHIEINTDGRCRARTSNNGSNVSAFSGSGSGVALDTWAHFAGVFTSATSRAAFINGGSKGTNSSSSTPTGTFNGVAIGRTMAGTRNYHSGLLAEVAIWDIALSDAEVATLATGVKANTVQSGNLVFYAPILGNDSPEPELVTSGSVTVNGTTAEPSDHPVDWSESNIAAISHYYNQMRQN